MKNLSEVLFESTKQEDIALVFEKFVMSDEFANDPDKENHLKDLIYNQTGYVPNSDYNNLLLSSIKRNFKQRFKAPGEIIPEKPKKSFFGKMVDTFSKEKNPLTVKEVLENLNI